MRALREVLCVITCISVCVVIIWVGFIANGMRVTVITSNSMEPTILENSACIIEYRKPSEVKVDDILVYRYNRGLIAHRVVDIKGGNGGVGSEKRLFITKGDNNKFIDGVEVTEGMVVGVVVEIMNYTAGPIKMLLNISSGRFRFIPLLIVSTALAVISMRGRNENTYSDSRQ